MSDDIGDIFERAAPPPNHELRDRLWATLEQGGDGLLASASRSNDDAVALVELNAPRSRTSHRRAWIGALAAASLLVVGIGASVARTRNDIHVRTTPTSGPDSSAPSTNLSSTTSVSPTTSLAPAAPAATAATAIAPEQRPTPPGMPLWETLPSSGLSKREAALVINAGHNEVVLGGQESLYATNGSTTSFGPATRTDGAILNLDTKTWTKMAEAPMPLNSGAVAQWDGKHVLVVSQDGTALAYDPVTDQWSALATFPLRPRADALSTWTGKELLVWGGHELAPNPDGGLVPTSDGAAYRPETNSWRTMGNPRVGNVSKAVWTDNAWLTASGPLDYSVAGDNQVQVLQVYDPTANTWADTPGLPGGQWITAFGVKADSLVAAVDGGSLWERNPDRSWRKLTDVPMGGQVSVLSLSSVDDRAVVLADSGGTNGTYFGYGQASGAWVNIDRPYSVGFPVQTASGRMIQTDGTNAWLLGSIVDPTTSLDPCTSGDFTASATIEGPSSGAVISLVNHSDKACSIDGQRPSAVILSGPTHPPTSRPASRYASDPTSNGGYIGPGKSATIAVRGQQQPGSEVCPVKGPLTSLTFSVSSDADRVTIALELPDGCWDLEAITAVLP